MSSKTIITPVLKFWGFKRHPFGGQVLRGQDLELFVDRETEVRQMRSSTMSNKCLISRVRQGTYDAYAEYGACAIHGLDSGRIRQLMSVAEI